MRVHQTISLLTAALGISLAMPTQSHAASEPPTVETPAPRHPQLGWYLGQSTRLMGNLGHAHVAMGTEFGLRWRNLAFGVSVTYRPASWSRGWINLQLPEGQTYKGQTTLRLGEQFMFGGFTVAPSVPLPRVPWLTLDFPMMLGVGFLGTPLMGDDRKTPDGRRVSAWEDELTGGNDIGFGLATDVGVRARFRPTRADWFHVAVGAHYLFVTGYRNPVLPDANLLSGPSASVSVILGRDPAAVAWPRAK